MARNFFFDGHLYSSDEESFTDDLGQGQGHVVYGEAQQLGEDIAEIREELRQATLAKASLKEEVETYKNLFQQAKFEKAALKGKLERLKVSLHQAQHEAREAKLEDQRRFYSHINNLAEVHQGLKASMKELGGDIEGEEMARLKKENEALLRENADKGAEVAELKRENEALRREANERFEENEDLCREIGEKDEEMENLKEENEDLSREIERLSQENVALSGEKVEKDEQIDAVTPEKIKIDRLQYLVSLKDGEINYLYNLQEENDALSREKDEEMEKLKSENESLSGENEEKDKKIADLRLENRTALDDIEKERRHQFEGLHHLVSAKDEKIVHLNKQLIDYDKEVEVAYKEITKLECLLLSKKAEIKELGLKNAALNEKLKAVEKSQAETCEELRETKQSNVQLLKAVDDVQKQLKAKDEDLINVKCEYNDLQIERNNVGSKAEEIAAELEKAIKQNEEDDKALAKAIQEIAKLKKLLLKNRIKSD